MCRQCCLLAGISSYLVLACSVVRLRCSLWYLVRGIVLYRLTGSHIVLLVLSPAVGRITSLLLSVVYRGRSCLLLLLVASLIVLWHLLQSVAVPARCSCRLSCRACCLWLSYRASQWPPHGPRGYPQAARLATLRRGGDFSKRGERQTETRPVPIFMRKVEKNVIFQRKTGEIQFETGEFQRKTGYDLRSGE